MKQPFEIIRNLREDADLDQLDVARHLNISQQVYSTYERGQYEIPSRHLAPLAQLFHVNVEYLLGITEYKGSIEKLNDLYSGGRTVGALVSDLMALDDAGRTAAVEYVDFLKTKTKRAK